MRTAKTLIRLGGCPGSSESSLGAESLCWFCHLSCCSSHVVQLAVGVRGVKDGCRAEMLTSFCLFCRALCIYIYIMNP